MTLPTENPASALARLLCALGACLCLWSFSAATALAAPMSVPSNSHTTTQFGRFGSVQLFKPPGAINGVAILASGDGRWDDPLMNQLAQQLVATGSAVVGIDTVAFLQAQDDGDQCVYMAADFEDLAHAMEKQLSIQSYLPPVLVGDSSGAALVYAVLGQAPRGMFQAGMSVGFCAELNLQASLCSGRGTLNKLVRNAETPTSQLLPVHELSASWVVLQGEQDEICRVSTARQFTTQVMAAQLRTLPKVGHFFETPRDWRNDFVNAYQGIKPRMHITALPPEVSDLPVTEVPSTRSGDELAILFTGDGGWAELDQQLARDLAHAGVSVVALSSLQYFWQSRTPQHAASDLSRLMAHYSQVWQRPRVHLLGYSFGADVLPAIINALPAADRARVVSVGLLSLLPRTSFEIRVAGWLGKVVGEQPVQPELERLAATGMPITCVYGRDDMESLCRTLPTHIARTMALPGGHNCDDDHAAIVHAWLNTRAATPPTTQTTRATGVRANFNNVPSARREPL